MIRYVCPHCWRDLPHDAERCPFCGGEWAESWKSLEYADKLIRALGHPILDVRIRAARILGRLGEARAVRPLIEAMRSNSNVYVLAALAGALKEIGGPEASAHLHTLGGHPAAMVRAAARKEGPDPEGSTAEN